MTLKKKVGFSVQQLTISNLEIRTGLGYFRMASLREAFRVLRLNESQRTVEMEEERFKD